MNIRELLNEKAEKYSVKPAIIWREKQVTFPQLRDQAFKLANVLREAGIGKGDKVAVFLPNSFEFVYSYLACFCLGAVCVPLDFMLKEDELISCLSHSEAKLLIGKSNNQVDIENVQAHVRTLKKIIDCNEEATCNIYELIDKAGTDILEVDINDKDPSLIMYTSGTTGRPKGILLNYKHLEGSPAAMEHFVDLSDKDIKLAAIPLSHIGGFVYLQNCINFGITLIVMERFNPFEFLGLVSRHKVTCFHIVPPMYNAILTLKQIDKFDLSSLRWVVVFGAPSSPEILERFNKYCPNAKLLNGWGMTETCPPNTVTPLDSDNIASVGKPAPHCEIRVVDGTGKELSVGEIGEIVISGWIIMDEYYKDQEETERIKKNGWLYTGDLGRFDKDGFLYIVGRKKEMIKVGGQIVYAPEVEAALYKNDNISEAAVIGIPDKLRGEIIKAFVVLREGSGLAPEDIRHFAREHLANFKVPQSVEIKDDLPKNRTGKIDKNSLKQMVTMVGE